MIRIFKLHRRDDAQAQAERDVHDKLLDDDFKLI